MASLKKGGGDVSTSGKTDNDADDRADLGGGGEDGAGGGGASDRLREFGIPGEDGEDAEVELDIPDDLDNEEQEAEEEEEEELLLFSDSCGAANTANDNSTLATPTEEDADDEDGDEGDNSSGAVAAAAVVEQERLREEEEGSPEEEEAPVPELQGAAAADQCDYSDAQVEAEEPVSPVDAPEAARAEKMVAMESALMASLT